MTSRDQSPATKKDVQLLMERIGAYYEKTEKRFSGIEEHMENLAEETKRHFDVVAEDMRHDLLWANREEILVLQDARKNHEKRIRSLERRNGLIAA